jgi:hypothetical protein
MSADSKRAAGKQRAGSGKQRGPNATSFRKGNPYRWKPGQSGNPSGAKPGPKLSDLLREAMSQPMPPDRKQALLDLIDSGARIGQIIGWTVSLRAADGDLEALGVIADRTEGAPEQTLRLHEVNGDDLARARERAAEYEQQRFAANDAGTGT